MLKVLWLPGAYVLTSDAGGGVGSGRHLCNELSAVWTHVPVVINLHSHSALYRVDPGRGQNDKEFKKYNIVQR